MSYLEKKIAGLPEQQWDLHLTPMEAHRCLALIRTLWNDLSDGGDAQPGETLYALIRWLEEDAKRDPPKRRRANG